MRTGSYWSVIKVKSFVDPDEPALGQRNIFSDLTGFGIARLSASRVMIAGGFRNQHQNNRSVTTVSKEVLAYDVKNNTWEKLPSMITPRSQFVLEALPDGKFLAAGGKTDKVEMYDPLTKAWSALSDCEVWKQNSYSHPYWSSYGQTSGHFAIQDGKLAHVHHRHGNVHTYDATTDEWTNIWTKTTEFVKVLCSGTTYYGTPYVRRPMQLLSLGPDLIAVGRRSSSYGSNVGHVSILVDNT